MAEKKMPLVKEHFWREGGLHRYQPPTLGLSNAPAVMTDVVLNCIFSKLRNHQLKKCRLVCKKWNELACPLLSRRSQIFFGKIPSVFFREAPLQRHVTNYVDDAVEFLNCLGNRNPDIGITFANINIVPDYLPDFTGDILLHPQIRNGIKILEIAIYPTQIEWLKTCIRGMPNLRELTVLLHSDSEIILITPPPSSNIPKKLLTMDGKLPQTLQIPKEFLESVKHSDSINDLVLENLSLRGGSCGSNHTRGHDEAQEFWRYCLQGNENSLRYWILERAPQLKYLLCTYGCWQSYVETLRHVLKEYKGNGLQCFRIEGGLEDPRPWMNQNYDRVLQEFLKMNCLDGLEVLEIDHPLPQCHKILFRFPDLPFARLKKLVITTQTDLRNYKDSDFKWVPYYCKKPSRKHRIGDLEGYVLTEKFGREELTDHFNIFSQTHTLNVLENLELHTFIDFQYRRASVWFKNIKKHKLKLTTLLAHTTRSFPRVKNLVLDVHVYEYCDSDWGHRKGLILAVDYTSLLNTTFPSLKKFRPVSLNMSLANKLLKHLPEKLETLQFYGCQSERPVTDKTLLGNKALLRLSELGELSFDCCKCNFSDNIIYKGFLKLPKLQVVRANSYFKECENSLKFSTNALNQLRSKLDILEYSENKFVRDWPSS